MFFKPSTLSVGLALSLALTLTACSKDTAKPAATANPTGITINNASEPETLDPQLAQGVQEANIIRQFSEGLVSTDNDGNLIPGIATEWTTSDNKVWTFKLRDAKWSNGDPVTAEDFVYSFRRLVDPATGSYYASYLEDAKLVNAQAVIDGKVKPEELGIKAIDDKTLEITLSEPVPYFVDMMIHSSVQPVHRATVEKFGEKWTDPANIVVNGAYKPSEWVINEKIVLQKNPSYYDADKVKLESLTVLPIPQATTDVLRYQAGEIDITASELPPEQFEQLKKDHGDELKTAPTLCTYYYDLNHEKPPFNDPKVRQALALTLDREQIAEKVMGQGQVVAYQFTPTAIKGNVKYTPEWQAWDKAKRIEEAKKLLAEAGYSESNPLNFDLLYDTNESHKKIAVAASSLWKDSLGFVNVNLTNQEWKSYLDSRRNGNYQMARARWCGDYNEASTFLNLRKSNNTNNWTRYKSAEFDKVMAQTLAADLSDADRVKLYEQAEGILDKDHAHIDIFYYANVRLVKPRVGNYANKDPLDQWHAKYWTLQ
ncbi:ABC transporter substrate-binding protein [Moraxella pluranimalium]|uniref:Oligopeptide ABC transporter substrate-binding protein OppA n=1 Tax=Moraxella pluranimalium TaxID=470453 RepID=A0A1T0CLZ3_9GAMM|nr:ABC transporter substrate-binding protein [Moraxella pluranimalium]OOS23372.1 oligopeptide ABC transporter substrate-binding protein OppA [Moraxella pluranimalium]